MELEKIDLNDVLGFVRVVESASFSSASRKMGVPKSSLSRRVARLEAALATRLLHRTSRSLSLTEVGRELYERATASLRLLGEATLAASEGSELPRGTVRVSAPSDVGAEVLPALVASFVARYPDVRVEVEVAAPMTDLVEGGYDLAIRGGRQHDSSLTIRKLQEMKFRLFAAPAYLGRTRVPRKVDDLAKLACILFRTRRGKSRWVLHGKRGQVEVDVTGAIAADDLAFIRRAAIAGAGVALLPEIVGEQMVESGALVRVLPDYHATGNALYLVYPAAKQMPLKVAKFRDHLLQHFAPSKLAARAE
jgi:DNA-binding transcriptional LysR family regulator